MSNLSNGILGALAAAITLGAMQLAFGNDLSDTVLNRHDRMQAMAESHSPINRGAKADRVAGVRHSLGQSKTLSFQVDHMPDTLVLVRVSAVRIEPAISDKMTKTATAKKSTLACEPVVSVLTDVAKVLEPGRCLT